ncbi:MAG TPA: MaoC family dehydratase [Myxococcales bacterium]|jgi:3-hydroxybutyryl-CoA dehydratase
MRFKIGDTASTSRTVTEADIVIFGGVTGDLNPAHFDEAWAKTTRFGGRIAHGMLTAGYVSAVVGMKLPGPGAIYLSQSLKFTAPVRIGDTITAKVEVAEIIENKRLRLLTTATNQDGKVVLEGEALVLPPRE